MSRRAAPWPLPSSLSLGHLYRSWLRGFLLYKLFTLGVNMLSFPVLRFRPPHPHPLRVSLLVPARDEAHNLPHTLPGLLAQGADEVILLDDSSGDGTGDLARRLGEASPAAGLRVLDGLPRPPGWHGKPWACEQLGQAATGEVLVFTDADVSWRPGALAAVLHELERSRADLLSVWPRQETRRPGERLLVPLVDDVLLGLLPAPLVRLPFASLSAGNGQLMAFRQESYRGVGGHALVRSEVLEDVLFASRLKARGGQLALALGGELLSVRMYRGYRESVLGLAKSLPVAHGHSRPLLALSWFWHLAAYTLPLFFGPRGLVLLGLAGRLGVNLKTGRRRPADLAEVLLTPLAPLASLPVYLLALRREY
ncbi:MAG: glycosyltransferase, partial [Deinococcus sp.]